MQISFGQTLDITEDVKNFRTFFIFTFQNVISPWGNVVNVKSRGGLPAGSLEVAGHPNDFGFTVSLLLERSKMPFHLTIIVTDVHGIEHSFDVISHGFTANPRTIDIQDGI